MGAPHAPRLDTALTPLPAPDDRALLTDREVLLLQLLARGYSLPQCAQLVGMTGTEALADAQRAAAKLGVRDTTAAVIEAYRLELIV